MKSTLIIALLLILVGGGIFLLQGSTSTPAPGTTNTPVVTMTTSTPTAATTSPQTYTLATLAQHHTEADCWIAIEGKVYDASPFIASGQHNPAILDGCGKNATQMFEEERKHRRDKAQSILPTLAIGTLQ